MAKKLKHDALVKKLMSEVAAAKEFLEHYLPTDFKQIVDLSKLKVEKDTFVTNDLRRQLSDIVYSVPTLDDKTALVYILAEHVRHEVARIKSAAMQRGCI